MTVLKATSAEVIEARLPRKTSKHQVVQGRTKTDTGGRGEYPKALERTRVKELGKMVP